MTGTFVDWFIHIHSWFPFQWYMFLDNYTVCFGDYRCISSRFFLCITISLISFKIRDTLVSDHAKKCCMIYSSTCIPHFNILLCICLEKNWKRLLLHKHLIHVKTSSEKVGFNTQGLIDSNDDLKNEIDQEPFSRRTPPSQLKEHITPSSHSVIFFYHILVTI